MRTKPGKRAKDLNVQGQSLMLQPMQHRRSQLEDAQEKKKSTIELDIFLKKKLKSKSEL